MMPENNQASAWQMTVSERLTRIETLLETQVARRNDDKDNMENIAGRVSALERFRYTIMGGAAVAGSVFGLNSSTVVDKLFGK